MKEIGDRVRKFNESSRCAPLQQCVDLVKEGNTVYLAVNISYQFNIYNINVEIAIKCNIFVS